MRFLNCNYIWENYTNFVCVYACVCVCISEFSETFLIIIIATAFGGVCCQHTRNEESNCVSSVGWGSGLVYDKDWVSGLSKPQLLPILIKAVINSRFNYVFEKNFSVFDFSFLQEQRCDRGIIAVNL